MTRIGSLFSGYGGTDMAVRDAFGGGEVVWHSDIKPAACTLLAHRHPDVPNLGDMTAIDYRAVQPIDVLAASWPCQPHSLAGKRLGEKDHRALWPEVARAIESLRPTIFFGENVASITGKGELRRVVRSLADLRYVGAWRCFRASDVGACHRRDRCFVVAVDPAADADGRGLPQHPQRHSPADPGGAVQLGQDAVRRGARGEDRLTLLPTPHQNMTTGAGTSGRDGGLNLQTAVTLLPTPKATDGPKGGPGMRGSSGDLALPSAVQPANFGVYAEAVTRHEQVLGRPAPEPTQISPRNGKPQLGARFVEWMMMLPEGWVTDVPGLVDHPRKSERNAMLSLLGDGVVPAQGAAAFRFLLDHLATRIEAAA